jgi:hypothetical protein
MVKYRPQGRQRSYPVGKHGSPWTPELARREAKRILRLVAEGKDPADKKRKYRSAPTISALAERFLEEHVAAKAKDRTYTEYKRLIERVVTPELGLLKVDEIRSSDIEKLHRAILRGEAVARRQQGGCVVPCALKTGSRQEDPEAR